MILRFFAILLLYLVCTFGYFYNGKVVQRNRLFAKQQRPKAKGFGLPQKDIDESSTSIDIVVDTVAASPSTVNTGNSGSNFSESLNNSETLRTTQSNANSLIENTKLFQTKRERRIAELEDKIRQVEAEEALIASDPSVGAVPEYIADRMIGRIAIFFGIPVFGGLAIFVAAFFFSKKYDIVIPPTIIAYATQVPFVIGLAGISYAILSTSWDKEKGSALGISEFKTNFGRIQDGLSRTKKTAQLKEDIERERNSLGR